MYDDTNAGSNETMKQEICNKTVNRLSQIKRNCECILSNRSVVFHEKGNILWPKLKIDPTVFGICLIGI